MNVPDNRKDLYDRLSMMVKADLAGLEDVDVESFLYAELPKIINAVPAAAFDPIQPFESGVLFYHSDVNESDASELQHDLMRVHLNLGPGIPITINLTSTGGGVMAGTAIIATIREIQRAGRKVNVHVQGTAMSMGFFILQCADYRTAEDNAFMMIHEISSQVQGSVTDHRRQNKFSERLQAQLLAGFTARTGRSADYYLKKLKANDGDWYLSAQDALEEGFLDEVRCATPFNLTPGTAPATVKVPRRNVNRKAS